jgi:hypothetical protein
MSRQRTIRLAQSSPCDSDDANKSLPPRSPLESDDSASFATLEELYLYPI